MVEICALASGSNGNSYYIGNENEAILIDAGVYYKRLIERINDAGLDKSKIRAIFISHEHADHIQGIRVSSNKLGAPGIFSQHTFYKSRKKHQPDAFAFFKDGEAYRVGDIEVYPFKKSHDASDPYSFRIVCGGKNIGVFTDIGIVDGALQTEFSKCDAVFLETNYDTEMLWNGSYPAYIKQRIDSEKGHLSNKQALELVQNFASEQLQYIFLSHISDVNNTYELAIETFSVLNGKYQVKLATRQAVSEVIRW